jgi:hypothetical protein
MLQTILGYFTGRAAKAGVAALVGMIGAPAVVTGAEYTTGTDLEVTILGYVLIGALQGLINWVAVYFRRNAGDQRPPAGLY